MIVSVRIYQIQVLYNPLCYRSIMVEMGETVSFLDFEASSLSDKSYPIEIAWSASDGSIESYLISPAGIDSWTDWDPASEQVHGISRDTLLAHGLDPTILCERMIRQLPGQVIYTDAPKFDAAWLARLFSASGKDSPGFELRHVDDLLVQLICPDLAGRTQGLIRIEILKQEARRQKPRRHRAAWDVEYLVRLWELARYHGRS
jgi:hypothetical protein